MIRIHSSSKTMIFHSEKRMNNSKLVNICSGKDDWRTPPDLFMALDKVFHFTLDPCSTHENALCEKHFTKEEDGLIQKWGGEIVFMNPPYCYETGKWIKKAYEESVNGATVVCLIPARPDTEYWHEYIFPYAANIRFLKKRLHFSGSKKCAAFPSAIVVFSHGIHGAYKHMTF